MEEIRMNDQTDNNITNPKTTDIRGSRSKIALRSVFILFTAVVLLLSILFIKPLKEVYAGKTKNSMTVSKTEFKYGEPILITAEGSGKDWVGLYKPDGKSSLLWVYIDPSNGGIGSGEEFDILSYGIINDGSEYVDIVPGNYILRLMPDDTSDLSLAIETISITVSSEKYEPEAKSTLFESAVYEPAGGGFGGGTLKIKLKETGSAAAVLPYWADNNGILDGYTPLPKIKIKNGSASCTFPASMIIPDGVTQMRLYTLDKRGKRSDDYYSIDLPENCGFKMPEGKPVEFQVISDIHITNNDAHIHDVHFGAVMKEISAVSPGSIGIFIVGDMANTGNEAEYIQMKRIYDNAGKLPPLFMAIGNHDLYNGSAEDQNRLFLKYAVLPDGKNPESPHYDFWLKGFHFVFLGNDQLVRGVDTTLSENTLKWLKNTLDERRDGKRPIFLFIHQSLYDTVAGSLPGQNWNGVANDAEFRDVIFRYPEIVMFNGHSHWTMDSERNIWHEDDKPYIFNTASTAYLWTSYNIVTGENLDGSQGYYIYLYDDKIIVRGRDFERGQWIPAAQYCLTGFKNWTDGRSANNTRSVIIAAVIAIGLTLAISATIIVIALKRRKRV